MISSNMGKILEKKSKLSAPTGTQSSVRLSSRLSVCPAQVCLKQSVFTCLPQIFQLIFQLFLRTMSKLRRTVGTKNCKSNRFSTADYYTFPASIQKETSLEVPKCLHFIYIGKAIRDNYVENIRQNLNQYFSCRLKLFQLKIEGLCNKLKSKHIKIKIDQYFG